MEDADFKCIVPFSDGSASFVHGFEAGILWTRMQAGGREIANEVAYHVANAEVFQRMAAACGYDMRTKPYDDIYMTVAFTKRRLHLSVVK